MQNITRRDALRLLGASAAATAAGCTLTRSAGELQEVSCDKPNATLQAKARKNFKLGILTGVYGGLPLDEAARRMKEDGFTCVVLNYNYKDIVFNPAKPDWDVLKKITTAMDKNGLEIVGLFGYYNLIDPDADRRKPGEQHMDLLLNNWKRFGSNIISTETGTFDLKSQWDEDPKNHTEEGYKACRTAIDKLARAAEKAKAVIAIECYWKHVIGSAEKAERLLRDVASPALKLTMDPCNYFRNEDLPNMDSALKDIFKRVGKHTALAHAKDVKALPDGGQALPAAGKGVMNYPLYLRLLAQLDRPMPLTIEHLELKDVARARDYVKAQIEKI